MRMPQLFIATTLTVATIAACNRTETNRQAEEAAAEVRTATQRAGEQLADGWLTAKIQAQYFADDDIKARYINVSTRNGRATLSGYVENEQAREQVLQIARNTDGVRAVDDKLMIGQATADAFEPTAESTADATATTGRVEEAVEPAAAVIDDARITSMIQAKYFLDSAVKARRIDVDTRSGVVTLRGEVASESERAQALLLARSTDGVQRVEDVLTVNAALGIETQ